MAARVGCPPQRRQSKNLSKSQEILGAAFALSEGTPSVHVKTPAFSRRNLLCSCSHKTFWIGSAGNLQRHVRARKNAYNQRNLSPPSGREHLGRLAVRFCAPHLLQPAVELLHERSL